jgi:16S rRNA (cytosine967-C5)-methyltransferase
VLDLCAAPGGKALMLAEHLADGGILTAADRSARRQELTRENFRRRQLAARIITARPEDIVGKYDLVLADVPCSNSGVFRRRPDALWRFSAKSLQDVMALQQNIITRAAELVAPGGVLICSTCSIESDENDALIAAVLNANAEFSCVEKETLLPDAVHDGAFAAKLRRR